MNGQNLSPKIARALHEFGDAAPPPPSVEDVRSHQPSAPRRRIAVSLAAAALVAAGVVGTVAVTGRDVAAPASERAVEVHHSRYRVSWTADLACETPIDNPATFDTVIIDTWSDREGRRWRNQATYPDGSTHDLILQGSAIYPTAQFERGRRLDSNLGCVGPNGEPFILVAGPGLFFSLTLAPELGPDERPFVRLYDDWGTLVDAHAADSLGRPSQQWEQRTSGTAGYGSVADHPVIQVTTWWVDAVDATTVTERTYINNVQTLGTAMQTQTLLFDETITAADDLFATNGYQALGPTPRPDAPSGGPDTTGSATGSPFDNGAALIVYVKPGATAEQVDLIRNAILQASIVAETELRYLDVPASIVEAQRIYADDPATWALFDESTIPTMFQFFPADRSTFDSQEWRSELLALPNVFQVTAPTDDQSDRIPVVLGESPESVPAPSTPGPDTSVAAECVGDDLDIAHEPTDWRQPENESWFRNGCLVRIDVITDQPGPDHCGWGTARVVIFGSPLGARFVGGPTNQYVRDPANVLGQRFDVGFDGDIDLPPIATNTGYYTDTEELWTVPGEDEFIYLVLYGRVERWPSGESPVCD